MPHVPIIMPQLGESIAEATIVSFLVQPGDTVEADQDIIEVETNKATMNVVAPARGRIEQFTVQLGGSYPVGGSLGRIEVTKDEATRLGLDTAQLEKVGAQAAP
ncbi:MAG: lipoyl domain-containing protein, partial [Verrucomicrobia bacterium]|nr:lipoyl domain-containing protein [Verrucomicrobiota bacterium]